MAESHFQTAQNVWVATVRPDGRPHLTPVWFVVAGGAWYFVTDPQSVKARNLSQNSKVALALEDGSNPHIVEGVAGPVTPSAEVIQLFKNKYGWDITMDSQYSVVYEVKVTKRVMGSS